MINFKKIEMISLTNKEIKSYEKQKVCYICQYAIAPENLEELLIIFAI